MPQPHSDNRGFVVLISVIIVSAVGAVIAVSIILLSLGAGRTSYASQQSNMSKALANACAEEALQQINDSSPFTGTGNLSLGAGTCTYTVTNDGGQNRTITSLASVGQVQRKLIIILDAINPAISIVSWQEVADF